MALTAYELQRQARIAENRARMEELGLSQTLADIKTTAAATKSRAKQRRAGRKASAAASHAGPRRRSERVQGKPAPRYNEQVLSQVDREPGAGGTRDRRRMRENSAEEVYTLDHVMALGTREQEWELFVDGYDSEGNRLYDPVHGTTCHQCRQKTLGKRTSCSSCTSLTGQMCGDCLLMRYGENVDEVAANPDWTCPHCRDLCNCSFHRSRRGWAPTGSLYRRAVADGYASVAHYLVLNSLEPAARLGAMHLMPAELRTQVEAELASEAGGQEGSPEAAAVEEEEAVPLPKRRRRATGTKREIVKGEGKGVPLRRGLRTRATA